jgi:hypothetical protein
MSVEVTTAPVFHAGEPRVLFKSAGQAANWDVSADGKKFLIPVESGSPGYRVVLNWTAAMKDSKELSQGHPGRTLVVGPG